MARFGSCLWSFDIHSREVRYELLVAIPFRIQNQGALLFLGFAAVMFRPEEYAELKRHVEPRKLVCPVEFCSRYVVDAVSALTNNSIQFLDASLPAVIQLTR